MAIEVYNMIFRSGNPGTSNASASAGGETGGEEDKPDPAADCTAFRGDEEERKRARRQAGTERERRNDR